MNKKIFAFLLIVMLSFALLISCDFGGGHEHSMNYVAAKDATCNAEGNLEYWHCTDCGLYFNTSDGNDISYGEIPTTGATGVHSYEERAVDSMLVTPASCSSKAVYKTSCVCGATDGTTFEYGELADHTYHEEWNRFTATHHYKDAICSHTEFYIGEEHSIVDGVCTVCLYEYQTEGIVYVEISDGYAVKSYNGNSGELVIPKTYKGKPVTAIQDYAFSGHKEIVSVTIPEGIKTIGTEAFATLGITSLTLPDSVTSIGYGAFANCYNLRDITLSENLTAIPSCAFQFAYLGEYLVIPDSVKSIGQGAFEARFEYPYFNTSDNPVGYSGLVSVTIGSGVEYINGSFLSYHYRLSEVINNSNINTDDLYESWSNSVVTIHSGDTIIEKDGDFWYIKGDDGDYYLINYTGEAEAVVFPEEYNGNQYVINGGAIASDSVYMVTLTDGVKRVKMNAFYGTSNLFTIEIATYIGSDFFAADMFRSAPYRLVEVITNYGENYNFSMDSDYNYMQGLGGRLLSYHEDEKSRVRIVDDCAFITGDNGVNYFIGYVGNDDSYTLPDEYEGEGYVINENAVRWHTESITLSNNVTDILDSYYFYPQSAVTDENFSIYVPSTDNPYFWCLKIGDNATEIHEDTKILGCRSISERNASPTIGSNASVVLPEGVKIISEVLAKNCASLTEYKNAYYFGTATNPYEVLVSYIESQDELFIHKDTKVISKNVFYTSYNAYYINYTKVTFEGTVEDYFDIEFMNKNSHPCTRSNSTAETFYIGNTKFIEIDIPESVTAIKDYAFCNYHGTEISIPEGLSSIGAYAFYQAEITNLYIPASVTYIGEHAFERSSIEQLNVCSKYIGYKAFYDTDIVSLTLGKGVETIANNAFANCNDIHNVYIYPTVKSFACNAFIDSITSNSNNKNVNYYGSPSEWAQISFGNYCASPMYKDGTNFYYYDQISQENYSRRELTSFTANGMTGISPYAFMNIDTLTSVDLGTGVTSIGRYAFYECDSLQSVVGMENVEYIGRFAFYGCNNLSSITFSESLNEISRSAFYYCQKLSSIIIPEGAISIGDNAFGNCYEATTASLPSTLTYLGSDVFYNCNKIEAFTVAENCQAYKSVDGVLFTKDGSVLVRYPALKTNLTYTIPDGVKVIADYAFSGNSYLTEITVLSDVEIIGEYAFASMTTLESISFNENSKLTTIGQGAFASNACLVEFTIPESVTFIDIEVFYGCEALSSVIFVDTEGWTVSRDYSSYELSSEELSSSETAANYLSDSDYTYMTWVKNSDND